MQKELQLQTQVTEIGAHVGCEAGEEMVKRFFDKHPEIAYGHVIGKDIIAKILAQPSCEGLLVFPSYDNVGNMHLVYLGVDTDMKPITSLNIVTPDGSIIHQEATVGDNSKQQNDFVTDSW